MRFAEFFFKITEAKKVFQIYLTRRQEKVYYPVVIGNKRIKK